MNQYDEKYLEFGEYRNEPVGYTLFPFGVRSNLRSLINTPAITKTTTTTANEIIIRKMICVLGVHNV